MMPVYGGPSGCGRYGIIDTDVDGRLICHECGRSYRHLTTHIAQGHRLPPVEYRERHGLAVGAPLVAGDLREQMRSSWDRHAEAHLAALGATRDPDRARTHSRASSQWRPQIVAAKMARNAARRVDLTPEQVEALGDVVDIPGFAQRCRDLLARDGVPVNAIARAVGLSSATVAQRMRRYPPT